MTTKEIERSKERFSQIRKKPKGDNFIFVCWGDITELKLWRRNDERPSETPAAKEGMAGQASRLQPSIHGGMAAEKQPAKAKI